MPRLPPQAEIDWTDPSAPRARGFDDVYFSRHGGLAETEAVFLTGCRMPEAWADRDRFAIGELGFGSGLNVLAAWRLWKTTKKPHAILHIFSIEAFPLARADAARALASFSELAPLADQLLSQWPVRASAPQRLWFPEDGFALTLLTGHASAALASLRGRFDAWFLDGFAPARNVAMWTPDVFARVAALSAPGARLATFTVAGEVRRGLTAAGWVVEKKPGFGTKRERLEGVLGTQTLRAERDSGPKRVAIIGAGVAGAATAAALARRGVETVVVEAAPALGAGASGNPAGLVTPRLDRGGGGAEVFLAAYLDAVATYTRLGVFDPCGVLFHARDGGEAALADLLADPPLPPDWMSARDGAALHHRAGLVRTGVAIEAMLARAELLCEAEIAALERSGKGWLLRAPDGRARLKADAVVLACGAGLARFAPMRDLPIELSRGQIEWGAGPAPAQAVTRGSYVAPLGGGVLFGATFDKVDANGDDGASETSRAENLRALASLAPEIAAGVDAASLRSRASLRAATPDRLPLAGPLPGGAEHAGVYVIGGLGARGLTLAPLLGETIAGLMLNEPQILSGPALDAIDPARFLHRRARRGG